MKIRKTTQRLARLGILAAIGVLLTLFRFSLFPAVNYLEMEFADVPILMGTFLYGAPAGLALTFLVALLQGLLISPQSGAYGVFMHCVATGTLTTVAGLLYRASKKRREQGRGKLSGRCAAALSLGCGALSMAVVMFFANLLVTPYYLELFMPLEAARDTVWATMLWIVLFNLTKACINGTITFVLYKYVALALRWERRPH